MLISYDHLITYVPIIWWHFGERPESFGTPNMFVLLGWATYINQFVSSPLFGWVTGQTSSKSAKPTFAKKNI
jgi:hypothetical protein